MKSETKIHFQNLLDLFAAQALTPEQQQTVASAKTHFEQERQHFTVLTLHRNDLFDEGYLSRHLSDKQMEDIAGEIRHEYQRTNFWSLAGKQAADFGVPMQFDEQPLLIMASAEIQEIEPDDDYFSLEEIQDLLACENPAVVAVSNDNDIALIAALDGQAQGLAANDSASEICRSPEVSLLAANVKEIFGNMILCPKSDICDQAWDVMAATAGKNG